MSYFLPQVCFIHKCLISNTKTTPRIMLGKLLGMACQMEIEIREVNCFIEKKEVKKYS